MLVRAWRHHLSTNQKVERHGKYTAVHVMLSYEYAHVSTNAHPSSVCACAKWMRVLTWLQALQSPKPMSHRERMPGRHMKNTFKCCCNRLERIIVWIDTVMLLQSVPKAQGSCVCCYDNNQVWVNNVWVKINLETQHINKTYRIRFVRSRFSGLDKVEIIFSLPRRGKLMWIRSQNFSLCITLQRGNFVFIEWT